jgi:glutathione synthase/RimK-type ligase-like ATP-grasp enzyme
LGESAVAFVREEWEEFLLSMAVAPTGCRWVNHPHANRLADHKGYQLALAAQEGLRVPHTAITNDPAMVLDLVGQFPIVYKRLGAAPMPSVATKPFLVSDRARLAALATCPAMFQELIPARFDIRVTVIGGDVYSAEIDSQVGNSPLDWRFDYSVPFRPHNLDLETTDKIVRLVGRCGLSFAAIDLRLTPEGEYVFLDLNPNGQYLFVELLAGLPLTDRMAAFLACSTPTQDFPDL